MPPVRKSLAASAAVLLAGLSLSACATTEYVDEQIATVNGRVGALEARVQEVGQHADAANTAAQGAAADARTANQRIDQLTQRVDGIEQRIIERKPRN